MSDSGPFVREAMTPVLHVVEEHRPLEDALKEIEALSIKAAPVVAGDGGLKGLLVAEDGRQALANGDSSTAGEVCRSGVWVEADQPFEAALEKLQDAQVGRLPVVEGTTLVGEVTRGEIRYFHAKQTAGAEPEQRSKIRWRASGPNVVLTWGIDLSGEEFIAKAATHADFGPDKTVLEIGPGYGRLLREIFARELPFRRYVGLDISKANVKHLTRQLGRADVEFLLADIESASLDESFDIVLSSLTLKHLYPTFEAALRNIERHLAPGAVVIFDLIEGEAEEYPPDVDFMRGYTRTEVEQIVERAGLAVVAFDYVEHAPGWERLLVVGRKAG
jgi:SAM-dependent methyltransferase